MAQLNDHDAYLLRPTLTPMLLRLTPTVALLWKHSVLWIFLCRSQGRLLLSSGARRYGLQ